MGYIFQHGNRPQDRGFVAHRRDAQTINPCPFGRSGNHRRDKGLVALPRRRMLLPDRPLDSPQKARLLDNACGGLALRFGLGPEKPLGGAVQVDNPPLGIGDDNRVVQVFQRGIAHALGAKKSLLPGPTHYLKLCRHVVERLGKLPDFIVAAQGDSSP